MPFYLCINEDRARQKKYCVKISSVNGYTVESECNRSGIAEVTDIREVENLEDNYFFNIKCKTNTLYGILVAENDPQSKTDIFNDADTWYIIDQLKKSPNGIIDVAVKNYNDTESALYYVKRSKYVDQLLSNLNEAINIPVSEITFKKNNTAMHKLNKTLVQSSLGLFNKLYNNSKVFIFSLVGFTSLCAGMFLLYKNGFFENREFLKNSFQLLSLLS